MLFSRIYLLRLYFVYSNLSANMSDSAVRLPVQTTNSNAISFDLKASVQNMFSDMKTELMCHVDDRIAVAMHGDQVDREQTVPRCR